MADESNPFTRLFSPVQNSPDTIFGMVGRAAGLETPEAIQGEAVKQLAEMQQQNPNQDPSRTFMTWVATPKGQEVFSKDQNLLKSIGQDFIAAIRPPQATIAPNVGEGQSQGRYDPYTGKEISRFTNPGFHGVPAETTPVQSTPGGLRMSAQTPKAMTVGAGSAPAIVNNGKVSVGPTVPTVKEQETAGLINQAGLTGTPKARQIAESQVQTVEGAQRQAIDAMDIPANLKLALKAGTLEWKEDKNGAGEGMGSYQLYDKSGTVVPLPPKVKEEVSRVLSPPEPYNVEDPKHNMHFGAGAGSIGISEWGKLVRQANPTWNNPTSETLDQLRNNLKNIHAAMAGLQQGANGLGISEAKIKRILETGPSLGFNADAKSTLNRMIALGKNMATEIDANQAVMKDPMAPHEAYKKAYDQNVAYNRVLRTLPTPEQMQGAKTAIESGKLPSFTPSPEKVIEETGKAVKEGQRVITTTGRVDTGTLLKTIPSMGLREIGSIPDKAKLPPAARDALRQRLMELDRMTGD